MPTVTQKLSNPKPIMIRSGSVSDERIVILHTPRDLRRPRRQASLYNVAHVPLEYRINELADLKIEAWPLDQLLRPSNLMCAGPRDMFG